MRSHAVIVFIILLAAALRFHNLGTQSLWNDEGSSYVQATRSFTEIALNAAADIHPPGYYWALKIWRNVTGDTEFALRYLSALAGVLTVALAYGIAIRLHPQQKQFSDMMGWAAASLVAINTFSIFYSQEARMYAALALWSAASMWALAGLLNRINWRDALALGLFNGIGLWTQYAFPLVMLAQGIIALFWLFSQPNKKRALITHAVANLLAIALFLPLLPTAWQQITTWPNTGIDTAPATALSTILNWLAFGITHPEANTTWLAIMLMLTLFGLLSSNKRHITRFLPAVWVLVPVGIFIGAGLFREGNIKFLLPSQVGFALAVGQGIAVLWTLGTAQSTPHTAPTMRTTEVRRDQMLRQTLLARIAKLTALVALAAVLLNIMIAVPPLYNNTTYLRDDYRAIANRITANIDENDAIILNAPGQIEVFSYYYDGILDPIRIPMGLNDTANEIQSAARQTLRHSEDIFLVLWGDQERDPNGIVEQTLDQNAVKVSHDWYGDVQLVHYVKAATQFNFLYEFELNVLFDERIQIQSYALSDNQPQAGSVLQARIVWQGWQQLDERYKVTLQLLDSNGQLVAQTDTEPSNGQRPTDTWAVGELIEDNHALLIPPDTQETHFTLIVALYNPANPEQRLPVTRSQADYLTLTNIIVTQPEENR